MSKRIHNQDGKAHLPLFLFLLGTLAFSLSTLPHGTDTDHFMVTSLSSEFASDCTAMGNRISHGADEGHCTFEGRSGPLTNVRADVSVVLKKDSMNRDSSGNTVTSPEWITLVKVLCEGKHCPEDGRPIEVPNVVEKGGFKSIVARITEDFNTGAKQMAVRIKDAKARADQEQEDEEERKRCEFSDKKDRRGNRARLEGTKQMDCFYKNMANMDDEEASDYYERTVLPKLESLVTSQDVRKQRQGIAMIKALHDSGIGGEFIKESVSDLYKYGQFKTTELQQAMKIMNMNPNDPTRAGLIQQMRVSQFEADMYFRSRGLNVQNQNWPIGDQFGFNYGDTLLNNLQSFQNQLDRNYAALLQQHQNMLNWNPQQQQQPNGMQPQVMNPAAPWANNTQFTQNGPPPPPQGNTQYNQQLAQVQQNQQPQQQNMQAQSVPPVTSLQMNKSAATINRGISKR